MTASISSKAQTDKVSYKADVQSHKIEKRDDMIKLKEKQETFKNMVYVFWRMTEWELLEHIQLVSCERLIT